MAEGLAAFLGALALMFGAGFAVNEAELVKMRAQIEAAQAEMRVMAEAVEMQKKETAMMRGKIALLETENQSLLNHNKELEERLATAESRTRGAETERDALQKEAAILYRTNMANVEARADLEKWMQETRETLRAMQLEREKRDSLVALGLKSAKKVLRLEAKLRAMEAKTAKLENGLAAAKDALQGAERRNALLTGALSEKERVLAGVQDDLFKEAIKYRSAKRMWFNLGLAGIVLALVAGALIGARLILRSKRLSPSAGGSAKK